MQFFRKSKRKEIFEQSASVVCEYEFPSKMLEAGMPAPDFLLPGTTASRISLADFSGRPVILVFYPGDWTPVCGDQLALYNEVLELFAEHNAQLLGLSVDSIWSHKAYAESRGLKFPLLADFEPKGQVAKLYGVYDVSAGTTERAIFVIDRNGIIQWCHLSPKNINPGAHGILNALDALRVSED